MNLIIGGTGQVGRELLGLLAGQTKQTRVLVRSEEKQKEVERMGFEAVQGDLEKPATLKPAFKGVERLFLLTAATRDQSEKEKAVVDAAKDAGVRRVILLSALGATLDSPITLLRNHAISEEYLKASGLGWTILRPNAFMQNILGQSASIRTKGAFYGDYREGRVSLVDARDIAAIAAGCLMQEGHEGRIYDVTGSEALNLTQVAEKISSMLGTKVMYVDIAPEALARAMTSMGMPQWLATDLSLMGVKFAEGHGAIISDDVEHVTGRRPITLDQFLFGHRLMLRHAA
jgi:uncharacterized protein YbjT (DUF2867 family)